MKKMTILFINNECPQQLKIFDYKVNSIQTNDFIEKSLTTHRTTTRYDML